MLRAGRGSDDARDADDLGALARDGRRGRRRPRAGRRRGAAAGRPDVAVLGAAPLVAGVWDWRRRPADGPDRAAGRPSDAPPAAGTLRRRRRRSRRPPTCCVGVRPRRARARRGVGARSTAPGALPLVVHTVRTGPQELAFVDVQGVGPGAASVSEPSARRRPAPRSCCPRPRPLGDLPAAAAAARAHRRARVPAARRGRRAARRAPVRRPATGCGGSTGASPPAAPPTCTSSTSGASTRSRRRSWCWSSTRATTSAPTR